MAINQKSKSAAKAREAESAAARATYATSEKAATAREAYTKRYGGSATSVYTDTSGREVTITTTPEGKTTTSTSTASKPEANISLVSGKTAFVPPPSPPISRLSVSQPKVIGREGKFTRYSLDQQMRPTYSQTIKEVVRAGGNVRGETGFGGVRVSEINVPEGARGFTREKTLSEISVDELRKETPFATRTEIKTGKREEIYGGIPVSQLFPGGKAKIETETIRYRDTGIGGMSLLGGGEMSMAPPRKEKEKFDINKMRIYSLKENLLALPERKERGFEYLGEKISKGFTARVGLSPAGIPIIPGLLSYQPNILNKYKSPLDKYSFSLGKEGTKDVTKLLLEIGTYSLPVVGSISYGIDVSSFWMKAKSSPISYIKQNPLEAVGVSLPVVFKGVEKFPYLKNLIFPKGKVEQYVPTLREIKEVNPFSRQRATLILRDTRGDYIFGKTKNDELISIGGKIDKGETPKKAVLRELYEETGLTPKQLEKVRFKGKITTPEETFIVYESKLLPDVKITPQSDIKKIVSIPYSDIPKTTGATRFSPTSFKVSGENLRSYEVGIINYLETSKPSTQLFGETKSGKRFFLGTQSRYDIPGKQQLKYLDEKKLILIHGTPYSKLTRGLFSFGEKEFKIESKFFKRGTTPGLYVQPPISLGRKSDINKYLKGIVSIRKGEKLPDNFIVATPDYIGKEIGVSAYTRTKKAPGYLGLSYTGIVDQVSTSSKIIGIKLRRKPTALYFEESPTQIRPTLKTLKGIESEFIIPVGKTIRTKGRAEKITIAGKTLFVQPAEIVKETKINIPQKEDLSKNKNIYNKLKQKVSTPKQIREETREGRYLYAEDIYKKVLPKVVKETKYLSLIKKKEKYKQSSSSENKKKILGYTTPKLPGYTTPKLPGYTTPKLPGYTTPKLPGYTTPKLPGYTTPKLPGYTTPKLPPYTPPRIPPPRIPPYKFRLLPKETKQKRLPQKLIRPTKYLPSLVASEYKIRGKELKRLTGLEIRVIA